MTEPAPVLVPLAAIVSRMLGEGLLPVLVPAWPANRAATLAEHVGELERRARVAGHPLTIGWGGQPSVSEAAADELMAAARPAEAVAVATAPAEPVVAATPAEAFATGGLAGMRAAAAPGLAYIALPGRPPGEVTAFGPAGVVQRPSDHVTAGVAGPTVADRDWDAE